MPAKRPRARRQVFAFIDTNIFLDFYRSSNESTLKLLSRLKAVRGNIISTYQVEMEFLKNRQRVLLESYSKIKSPQSAPVPAILTDSKTHKSLQAVSKTVDKKYKLLKSRIVKLLGDPKKNDNVFQALSEIFSSPSDHVLTRVMPIRNQVKKKAWRRFILGYPPRKKTDTSIGDALNWEWIIHCGQTMTGRILIVSRDSDFGCSIGNAHFLNDGLKAEYCDRVGKRKSIGYTPKLSDALKELDVSVTQNEIEAEDEALLRRNESTDSNLKHIDDITQRIWKELARLKIDLLDQ